MADGLVWDHVPEHLRRPVLVAGFEGWNDAADAASSAAAWLSLHGATSATQVASIDPEMHFDFQSRRPTVEILDGVARGIAWPENVFSAVQREERDLVVLRGIEPSYYWRSFSSAVLEVARATGCELVVTFGALLADVPHTRTARVTGATTDPGLVDRLGLAPSTYQGPTGIVGVLHDHCRQVSMPSVSLWAPVPHYLASPPNPPATLALLDRLGALCGIEFDLDRLRRTGEVWRTKVDEVAAADDDVSSYVHTLEERYDQEVAARPEWGEDLPNGDELATEVERYLREQRGDR
ncbi:MAG TPA: PAC2 family protein [Acidimicrobiia bacterium]|nr:PAC2 family protein [Acidimicrobiia bacterium]